MENPSVDAGRYDWVIPITILLLAAITRLYGFWHWPLDGDELFTIRDALKGSFHTNMKPGMYVLVAGMLKWFGISEWTARFPSVFFGIISILVFYYISKDYTGRYGAACGSFLILLSDWHLYHSQLSRFYSAVFLFGILSYFLYFKAYRSGQSRYLIYAIICNGFGIIFHTTFVIVPFSCCTFSLLVLTVKPLQQLNNSKRIAAYYLVFYAIGAALIVPLAFRILSSWYLKGQHWGYEPFYQILAIVKYLTIPICISAFFGLIQLLKKDTFAGAFLGICVAIPIVIQSILSFYVDVRPDFIFFSAPLFFFLSGYLCRELAKKLSMDRFSPIVVVLIIAATMSPEFISYYTGKTTLDIRDAVKFVERNYEEGDKIVNFQNGFGYYLNRKYPLEKWLGNPKDPKIDWKTQLKPYEKTNERVWFVITVYRKGLADALQEWLLKNTQLVWEKQARRYGYSTESIRIFLKR